MNSALKLFLLLNELQQNLGVTLAYDDTRGPSGERVCGSVCAPWPVLIWSPMQGVFLLPGVRSGMSSGSRMDRDKVLTEDEGIDDVEREWNRGQDVTFDSFPGRNLN